MAISKDNTRILITVTKEQKDRLEFLAKNDKRSVSNLCYKIISNYLDIERGGEQL